MTVAQPKTLRCAVYTRVSTDHGLEQDFNSLDAQREAALAYVKSQAGEGWRPVRERYDDGGFSGGSLDRPALQRLLADIRDRRIDVVVVYKVDRLTRSLADFAKLVELFDAGRVSFVSVTQSFNTTTSMGRLTLNMLLSFAQFEREVTGERIRDKIAASKRRGIWVGGIVPLGYRVVDRKLVVDNGEAATVRRIFERYLALGSLPALQAELRREGIVSRLRTLSSGREVGGIAFTNGPLAHLLRNRVYLGEINHKGASYPGEHAAIVAAALFDAVGERMSANRNGVRRRRMASGALLCGRLFDDRGNPMTPSTARKGDLRYRYYVSAVLAQGRSAEAGSVRRVAASDVEAAVLAALRARVPSETDDHELVAAHLARAVIAGTGITLVLTDGGSVVAPWSPRAANPRRELIGAGQEPERPMRNEARTVLLRSIASGRRWLDEIVRGTVDGPGAIAIRDRCSKRHVERMIDLAFLSPDLVRAIAAGRLPRGINAAALGEMPMLWSRQWSNLGLADASAASAAPMLIA